jgi:8-oxo-dGTP pyrophosphatase MutT (NUDIX family)
MAEKQNRFTRAVVRTLERTDVLENKAPTMQKQVPFMQSMINRMRTMNKMQLRQMSEAARREYIEEVGISRVMKQLKDDGVPRFPSMGEQRGV